MMRIVAVLKLAGSPRYGMSHIRGVEFRVLFKKKENMKEIAEHIPTLLKTHASLLLSRLVTLPSTYTLPWIDTRIR